MQGGVSLFTQFWENYGTVCTQIPRLLSHRPKVQKSSLKFWLRDVGHFSIGQMTRVPVRYYNISPDQPLLVLLAALHLVLHPATHFHAHLLLLGPFRGCTIVAWHNMQESVPVVSHKFKSGLSVPKEIHRIECSQWGVALVLFLRWNISPIGPCTLCTGLNANFSFRQLQLLHSSRWMPPLARVNRG